MKLLSILMSDCKPHFKCGAEIGTAMLIGGGVSALGNLVGSGVQAYAAQQNVADQLDAQRDENQKNRDWQTQQAEIARQFEAQQVLQQNDFQRSLQAQQQKYNLQSMQKQAQLNSPAYMKQQLQNAGINPQVYFGNHSSFSGSSAVAGGSPSAPSGARSPMPSGVSGLSPVGYQPPFLNLANIGANIAGTIKTLAEAKKLGVETGWIDDRMKAEIRKLTADSSLQDVLRVGQAITNELNNAKLPFAYEMAAKEVALAASQIELNEQGKITQQSAVKVNEALAKLHEAQKRLTDKEVQKLGVEMPYYAGVLKSTISKNTAEASEAAINSTVLEEERQFKHLEVEFKEATNASQIEAEIGRLEAQKFRNEADKYENFIDLVKALKLSRAYENEDYAKLNVAIEELAKKFGIPIAVAFKLAFK